MAKPDQIVDDPDGLTPTTVDLSGGDPDTDPPDDETPTDAGDGGGAPPAPPQAARTGQPGVPGKAPRPSRQGFQQMVQGQQALTSQIQTLTSTVQQQQQIIQQLMSNGHAQGGQEQGASPTDQQISGLMSEQQQIMETVRAGNLSSEAATVLSQRYQALEDQRQTLRVQGMIEKAIAPLSQPRGGNEAAVEHARGVLQAEFPEVVGDPQASVQAKAYYNYLVTQGRPDGVNLLREACAHVASRLGLGGGRLGPSRASQAARSGVPNGATGADDGILTFDKSAMRQIRGAGVTPEQIAAEFMRQGAGR